LGVDDLARAALLSAEAVRGHLAALAAEGTVREVETARYVLSAAVSAAGEEILAALHRLHDQQPLSLGFAKKELFPLLTSPRVLVDRALGDLLQTGRVAVNDVGLHAPERAPRLSPGQALLAERLVNLYRDAGFATPRRDELPALVGTPAPVLERVLAHLLQRGDLVALSDAILLHRDRIAESARLIRAHFAAHATLQPGDMKTLLGATRKYAIPLLEYWDAHGLTFRRADLRELRDAPGGSSAMTGLRA
jgi:selenocysteine-specific elongation factor